MEIKSLQRLGFGATMTGLATKTYSGPCQELARGYGWDAIIPIVLYGIMSTFPPMEIFEKPVSRAVAAFSICSAGEIFQKFGLYQGTYDPKDFLAYATGASLALAIDLASKKISKNKSLKEVVAE